MGNSVDQDEVAHYEPPHQDLHCLQIQLFSSVRDLSNMYNYYHIATEAYSTTWVLIVDQCTNILDYSVLDRLRFHPLLFD